MLNKLLNLFVRRVDPSEFTAEMADYIRAADPTRQVEVVEPLHLKVWRGDEKPTEMHLRNVYLNYLQNPRMRKGFITLFAQSMLEADPEVCIPKNIVPTIKDNSFVEELRASIRAKGDNPDEYFVAEPYNELLSVVYAVDSPKSIRFLNPRDVAELDLHGETLRSFAVGNLKALLPPVSVEGALPLLTLKAGEMFESSLLLLDRVWDKRELGIEGEIVVAVPSRETLLVADSSSDAGMKRIVSSASYIAARSAYSITDKLFVRRDGSFVPLTSRQPTGSSA